MPMIISGSGTITGLVAGGLPDATVQPADLTQPLTQGTSVASTSGTAIDFTGIPSWAKRVTVLLNGVSTNGTSTWLVQIGSGSVTSTGYFSSSSFTGTATGVGASSTAGFIVANGNAAAVCYGHMVLTLLSSNTWVESHTIGDNVSGALYTFSGGGVSPALSGALDRVRITTTNGIDTFDAGSINIFYE